MLPEPKAFYDNPDIVRAFEFMKRAFGVCFIANHKLDYVTVLSSFPYLALSNCHLSLAVSFVKFNPLYRAIPLVHLTCLSVCVLPQGPSRLDASSATSASCPSSIPLARCMQWRLCSPDASRLPGGQGSWERRRVHKHTICRGIRHLPGALLPQKPVRGRLSGRLLPTNDPATATITS